MNKVQILREVITKLVPMLTSRGLRVTQVGAKAFVQTDAKTLKPVRVNIPHLPDDADEALIFAVQGFIDHEVGHVLDTDWAAVAKSLELGRSLADSRKMKPAVAAEMMRQYHNIVEDPFVERKMVERFKGSAYNVDKLYDIFIAKISKPAIDAATTPIERFNCILVPLIRSWAGQQRFIDFITVNGYDKDPLVEKFTSLVPAKVRQDIGKAKTSWDTLAAAQAIFDVLHPEPPPPPPAPEPKGDDQDDNDPDQGDADDQNDDQDQDDSDSEKSDDPDGEGSNEDKPEDEDDKGSGGEEQEDTDDEGDAGDGEASAEDDDDAADKDGDRDGSDASDDDGEADEKDDGESEKDDADAAGEGDPDDNDDAENDGADGSEESDDQNSGDDQSGDDGADGSDDADADEDSGDDADGSDENKLSDEAADDEDGSPKDGDSEDAGSDDAGDGDQDEDSDSEGAEGKDEVEGDSKDDQKDAEEGDGAPAPAADDEEGDGEETETEEKAEQSDNEIEHAPEPNPFETLDVKPGDDLAKAIEFIITNEASREIRDADYRVYTTEHDTVKTMVVPDDMPISWVGYLDDRTRHMVAPMQKDIERMMAARSQIVKVPGYRSGRLHSGSLHRLQVNDDRVFRRIQENRTKETAVSLLIDNSGSMHGNKMETAMAAGYALSQTLERVGIKHEVLGFTTGSYPKGVWEEQEAEERRLGKCFSRICTVDITVYKDFNERVTPEVKKRFAAAPRYARSAANVDGESVRVAANRLNQRNEPRKVLMVLSDGQPSGASHHPEEIYADLHRAVAQAEAAKIETIGIGIMDASVKTFYPKHAVLQNLGDLPKAVMGELKRILTQ